MISTYRVKIERCNGCHGSDRVVEFKIEPIRLLVRFCYACRAALRNALDAILKNDDAIKRFPRHHPYCKATGYNDVPCICVGAIKPEPVAPPATTVTLPNGQELPIDEVIDRSSIGRGLANIRENGIDAEVASLKVRARLRATRKPAQSTRKRAPTTRKKRPTARKARKKP
jgi:hypothetical protein